MWRLLAIGRKGPVMLCVVRWAQRTLHPEPYSLVQMDLTAPVLRWHDFATVEAAREALDHRCGSAAAQDGKVEVSLVVKLVVRDKR